jgi:hypothetical protein
MTPEGKESLKLRFPSSQLSTEQMARRNLEMFCAGEEMYTCIPLLRQPRGINEEKTYHCYNIFIVESETVIREQILNTFQVTLLLSAFHRLQQRERALITAAVNIHDRKRSLWNNHVVDRLCGLAALPGYTTEMYCVSCEVRTEIMLCRRK